MEVANPFIGLLQAFFQPTPSVTGGDGGGGVCVCGGGAQVIQQFALTLQNTVKK